MLFAALSAPAQLERFLFLGSCICLDCLLYVYTFLPLQLSVLLWEGTAGRLLRGSPSGKAAAGASADKA